MESRQREESTVEVTAEPGTELKAQWIKPEVNRLIAGGAESSSGASFDGADFPS